MARSLCNSRTRWHYFKTRSGFDRAAKRFAAKGLKFSPQINVAAACQFQILVWYPNPLLTAVPA